MTNEFGASVSTAGTPPLGLMIYATSSAAIVAILFLTNWPSYQYVAAGGPIPYYYYVLPAGLIVPLLFAEPGTAVRFAREPLLWWFLAFVLTGLAWLLLAQDFVEEAARQWRLRVLAFMLFYTVTVLCSEAHLRVLGYVISACVLMACALNWVDVLHPYTFVPKGIENATDGRGAGLFINPNAAGAFIVMGTIAALPMLPGRLRTAFLVAAVFGVAATFSRGAFVLTAVTILGAIGLRLVSRAQAMLLIVGLPLMFATVGLSYDYLIDASDNRQMQDIVERLGWFQGMREYDNAVEGRIHGAATAWQMFLENPATGGGTGATSLAIEGPHNMYLLFMAEHGVLGFFLYASLVGILIRRGWRTAKNAATPHDRDLCSVLLLLGVFLAIYGFFSHNVLEEPHTIFVLAFVVAAALRPAQSGDVPATTRPGRRQSPPHLTSAH